MSNSDPFKGSKISLAMHENAVNADRNFFRLLSAGCGAYAVLVTSAVLSSDMFYQNAPLFAQIAAALSIGLAVLGLIITLFAENYLSLILLHTSSAVALAELGQHEKAEAATRAATEAQNSFKSELASRSAATLLAVALVLGITALVGHLFVGRVWS